MVKAGSLILVHFVEQQLEGWTFARDHWPLHITLVPWFVVKDEEAVIRSLERSAADSQPLRLGVGKQEQFGENHDIPVNVINNQEPVRALHERLIETLSEADIAYNEKRFMGQSYMAHIIRHITDGRHSNEGEEILVNDFHLVRLVDSKTCMVDRQFDLAKH